MSIDTTDFSTAFGGMAQRATQLVSDAQQTLQASVNVDGLTSSLSDALGQLDTAGLDSILEEATDIVQNFSPDLGSIGDQITGVVEDLNLESFAGDIESAFQDLNLEGLGDLTNLDLGAFGSELANAVQSFDAGQLFSTLGDTFGNLTTDFLDISANLGALDFAFGPEGLEVNFDGAMDVLQRLNRELPGAVDDMFRQMEQQGLIVAGRSTSGLIAPGSARAPGRSASYIGTPPNRTAGPDDGSRASRPPADLTGRQPGRLAGTRVAFANSDPNQVPRQTIIDALNAMCNELNIDVQITPQGGWTGRPSGTNNHPIGYAADFQIIREGAIVRPRDDGGAYRNCAAALQRIANAKGIRPGLGGYNSFMHYDESPWRQNQWPQSKVGYWESGFRISDVLTL